MIGLDQTATIWGENNTTGAHDVVLVSGLRCRLAHVSLRLATDGFQRAELAARRNFIWEPSYELPETAVIEVNGVRWNPRPGTFGNFRGPSGQSVYRRCDVERGASS